MLECNASKFAIEAILPQLVSKTGQWHPVAFWSRKMAPPKRNYGVEKAEILAIVEACRHWRHYLKGSIYSIKIVTDYLNICKFLTTKTLSHKEAR